MLGVRFLEGGQDALVADDAGHHARLAFENRPDGEIAGSTCQDPVVGGRRAAALEVAQDHRAGRVGAIGLLELPLNLLGAARLVALYLKN